MCYLQVEAGKVLENAWPMHLCLNCIFFSNWSNGSCADTDYIKFCNSFQFVHIFILVASLCFISQLQRRYSLEAVWEFHLLSSRGHRKIDRWGSRGVILLSSHVPVKQCILPYLSFISHTGRRHCFVFSTSGVYANRYVGASYSERNSQCSSQRTSL